MGVMDELDNLIKKVSSLKEKDMPLYNEPRNEQAMRERADSVAQRQAAELMRRAVELTEIAEWVKGQPPFVEKMVFDYLMSSRR